MGRADAWTGADGLTRDGRVVRLRLLEAADAEQLQALHDQVSERNLRLRFFSVNRESASLYVQHLLEPGSSALTVVAIFEDRLVAVGTAEPEDASTMEVAFLVADDQHGRGIGSLLLAHLARLARDRGVRRFVADVLGENLEMRRVFLEAGFDLTAVQETGVTTLTIDLTLTPRVLEAGDTREEEAERRSLQPLLRPESVVVLGVRRDGTGVGAAVLSSIRSGGFPGEVDVVHPAGGTVAGVPAATSCAGLSSRPDLAVVAVPAAQAPTALRDVAAAGIPAAVVVSSGFGEMGAGGARLQREIRTIARRHSIRLVGPNCLGVMHNSAGSVLNATFTSAVPPLGQVAVASQSGGVGIVLLEAARATGLGVGSFVSLGNKADVSGNDLLAAWLHDPEVSVACLYLESFGNAHKFARLARRFARSKPLLAVVGGRSEGGRRAGASHTAAAASGAVAVDALLATSGVIRCDGANDMAEAALVLDQQQPVAGRRLGIVTNAGGIGVLAADQAEAVGLDVPRFSAELGERLAGALSATAGSTNPVDTGAGSTPAQMVEAVRHVSTSDEVDSVLLVVVATALLDVQSVVTELGRMRRDHVGTPMILVVLGVDPVDRELAPDVTVMAGYTEAVRALARSAARTEWLAQVADTTSEDLVRRARSRELAARQLAEQPQGEGWLGWAAIAELLGHFGLSLSGEATADAAQALAAARHQGYPVAAKVTSAAGAHKTEGGLVRVGIRDEAELERVVAEWNARLGPVEVVVQPLASGVEIAVGLVRDAVVGPLVMVAAGGIDIDVWNDRAFLLAPTSASDVRRALQDLRVWPLLQGHRGSQPVDVDALAELVVAIGRLGDEVPEVQELDLNPVIVSASGCALVDARVRLGAAALRRGDAPELG